MSSLLIKNIPENLHKRLKEQADLHHRSMNKQVVSILEEALVGSGFDRLPNPVRLKFKPTNEWLEKAKRWGRR